MRPPDEPVRLSQVRANIAPYLYILPALAIYALFVIMPIGDSFRLSLFRWRSAGAEPQFIGLANFGELLGKGAFWSALGNNALLLVLSLLIQLPIALGLAVLLSYPVRGRWLFRTVFFAPMVMPSVAIAVLWSYIYLPADGLLDQVIGLFNKGFAGTWLANSTTAMLCVFVIICWRYIGFHMVLFMAGIATIPEDLYEAARIDGASEWQAFRHVTVPMLRPVIAVSATLSIIGSLKYFDLVYMMMPEGTDQELMATYVYKQAFRQERIGYGSAAAVVLFLIAFAVVAVIMLRRRKGAT